MLSAEINVSVKIKIEINISVAGKLFIDENFLSGKFVKEKSDKTFITFPKILN